MRILTSLTILLSACGGTSGTPTVDGPPASHDAAIDTPASNCGVAGNGSITGTVKTETFSPIVRAFVVTISGTMHAIVLDETSGTGTCSNASTGKHLVMAFCNPPTASAYNVVDPFSCPNANVGGLIEKGSGTDFATGTGGTVTIQSADASCVRGNFNMQLASDTLTGAFNAVICP